MQNPCNQNVFDSKLITNIKGNRPLSLVLLLITHNKEANDAQPAKSANCGKCNNLSFSNINYFSYRKIKKN